MLNWFFKNRKKLNPINFSILKTDVHSHLIPSIDDGAQTLEESLDIILTLNNFGFSKLITTPHTMSDFYKNTNETINNGTYLVRDCLRKSNIDIEFEAASEYYVDFDFQKDIEKKNFLTFGSKYLLIEFPFVDEPKNIDNIIFQLQLAGYNVVLAHPERYMYFELKDYIKFAEKGVFLQLNLLSITGYYSPIVMKKAKQLIDEDLISFVGTDCHNIRQARNLEQCFTHPLWHQLLKSDKLLNNTL